MSCLARRSAPCENSNSHPLDVLTPEEHNLRAGIKGPTCSQTSNQISEHYPEAARQREGIRASDEPCARLGPGFGVLRALVQNVLLRISVCNIGLSLNFKLLLPLRNVTRWHALAVRSRSIAASTDHGSLGACVRETFSSGRIFELRRVMMCR